MKRKYPKSEKTIIKNKYDYKGIKYVNDLGYPCLYRIIENGIDTLEIVQYYRGSLLQVMNVNKQP